MEKQRHWNAKCDRSQYFFQDVSFFFVLFSFSNHKFWPCCYGFLLPSFACERYVFSSHMISVTVSWLQGFDDHVIILAVKRLSWREFDSWSFGNGLF